MKAGSPVPVDFVAEFNREPGRREDIAGLADIHVEGFGERRLAGKKKEGGAQDHGAVTKDRFHVVLATLPFSSRTPAEATWEK